VLRDDSFLYTGVTSATDRKPTPRQIQRDVTESQRLKLKDAYEPVLADITAEKQNVTDIRTFVLDRDTTEQEVNTELLARKLYLGYLNGLEARIQRIVAKKPTKRPKGESSDE